MTTIKLRRGSKNEWDSANPILSAGELGVELDTSKHKIGDGIAPWAGLGYYIPESQIDSKIAASMAAHLAPGDPHTQYLQPSEIMQGANILVDTLTSPGSVIISSTASGGMDQAEADARYLQPIDLVAGPNISLDTMTTPGSVIISSTATGLDQAAGDARYLKLTGGSLSGPLNMNSQRITNVGSPVASSDAATRGWATGIFLPISGDAYRYGSLSLDVAAGTAFTAYSSTLRGQLFAEESNQKIFISSWSRGGTMSVRPITYQASTHSFEYGPVEIAWHLNVNNSVTVGGGQTYGEIYWWTTSYKNLLRSAGSLGYYFYNEGLTMMKLHGSAFLVNSRSFGSRSAVPEVARFQAPSVTIEPEIDTTMLLAVVYDALMALDGGPEALSLAASRVARR